MGVANLLVLVCTSQLTPHAVGEPVPSARDLERKILDYRRSLERGHVVLKESHAISRNNPVYEKITRTYDLTFGGPSVRSIVNWKHPEWERTTRAIVTEKDYIKDDNDQFPVKMGAWSDRKDRPQDAIHPSLIGLLNGPLSEFRSREMADIFWYAARGVEPVVTAGQVGVEKAWRIDYQDPGRRLCATLIVVPRFGYGVTSIEVDTVAADGQIIPVHSTEAGYGRYGDYWYPGKVVYRCSARAGVSEEEIMEVESAEFNARIDPKTFEIEGLGLPVDRRVLDPGRFMKLWDGKRLIDTVFGK